jgi:hypothetical protein
MARKGTGYDRLEEGLNALISFDDTGRLHKRALEEASNLVSLGWSRDQIARALEYGWIRAYALKTQGLPWRDTPPVLEPPDDTTVADYIARGGFSKPPPVTGDDAAMARFLDQEGLLSEIKARAATGLTGSPIEMEQSVADIEVETPRLARLEEEYFSEKLRRKGAR